MQQMPRLLIVEDDGLITLDLVDMVSDFGFCARKPRRLTWP